MELIFLGTGGGRFVVAKQFRASGGLLLRKDKNYLLLDPGPGCLIQLARLKIPLNRIKAVVLSHIHLDHSADLNVVVDAITEGGLKKRGYLFLPQTALEECIPLPYLRKYVKEIKILKEHTTYSVEGFTFKTSCKLLHGVENYGFIFYLESKKTLGILSDTAYFEGLEQEFKEVNYLILNTLRFSPKKELLHLSIEDARKILKVVKPELAILTHFGMTMLRANPFKIAQELSKELGIKILAAYDRMKLDLENLK